MKALLTFVTVVSIAILAGCKLSIPMFDAATVEVHTGGRLIQRGVLSDSQVKALKEWLRVRKTGWEHRIESTAPALFVKLEHQGKVVAVMNIMNHEVKVGDLFRRITPEERDMLHLVLSAFLSPKKEANKAPEPTRAIGTFSQGSEDFDATAGVAHL